MLFDEILKIADNANGDMMVVKRPDGSTATRVNYENINRSRLMVDARKWIASKLAPRKYGDTATLLAPNLDEDGKPVAPKINILRYPLTKEEAAAQARLVDGDGEYGANGKTRHRGPD